MKKNLVMSAALLGLTATWSVVHADQTLGGSVLTHIGSEKAGNADGTIPAYTGQALKAPAGYDPKNPGQRPDPFGDKPLFSITAANYEQYADKLDAMVEMFKRYPDYRMDIYPTHRSFTYPQYVLDNTVKNLASCKTTANELKLEGCYGGLPFPIPKTGNEAMWNHLLQYQHYAVEFSTTSYVTGTDGRGTLQTGSIATLQSPYFDPAKTTPNATDTLYWLFRQNDHAPARKAGGSFVVQDSLDMVDVGRRVYQYLPGQRRVRLAPNLAYDTPSPNSGGVSTMDDAGAFLGALDRYDFKLSGKKEKFILYNNHMLTDANACTDAQIVNHKNFPNPDCVRWELHRVWVVEATLKPGFRHLYPKRVFYWNEDAPGAGTAEAYDASGDLFRITSTLVFPFYEHEGGGGFVNSTFQYDLKSGNWFVQGLAGFPRGGFWPVGPRPMSYFSPDALAGSGVR